MAKEYDPRDEETPAEKAARERREADAKAAHAKQVDETNKATRDQQKPPSGIWD